MCIFCELIKHQKFRFHQEIGFNNLLYQVFEFLNPTTTLNNIVTLVVLLSIINFFAVQLYFAMPTFWMGKSFFTLNDRFNSNKYLRKLSKYLIRWIVKY